MKSFACSPFILALATLTTAALPSDKPSDNPAGNTHNNPPSVVTLTVSVPTSPAPPSPTQSGCPTVTATRELCTTCPVPMCLGLATVTQSCGCPSAIPTVYLDFPCEENCKGVWCSTSYDVVTATGTCGGSGPGTGGGDGAVPTPAPNLNGTGTGGGSAGGTGKPPGGSSTSTSTFRQVNAAGRMAVPRWMGWF